MTATCRYEVWGSLNWLHHCSCNPLIMPPGRVGQVIIGLEVESEPSHKYPGPPSIILYYTAIPYSTTLYPTILYYSIFYFILLDPIKYIVLQYTIQYYTPVPGRRPEGTSLGPAPWPRFGVRPGILRGVPPARVQGPGCTADFYRSVVLYDDLQFSRSDPLIEVSKPLNCR